MWFAQPVAKSGLVKARQRRKRACLDKRQRACQSSCNVVIVNETWSTPTPSDIACTTPFSLAATFTLAIPAPWRWSSGRFTRLQRTVRRNPDKPPAMAVFSFIDPIHHPDTEYSMPRTDDLRIREMKELTPPASPETRG